MVPNVGQLRGAAHERGSSVFCSGCLWVGSSDVGVNTIGNSVHTYPIRCEINGSHHDRSLFCTSATHTTQE